MYHIVNTLLCVIGIIFSFLVVFSLFRKINNTLLEAKNLGLSIKNVLQYTFNPVKQTEQYIMVIIVCLWLITQFLHNI